LHSNWEEDAMKIQASFVKDGKWWVAWTDDVPGALTQGATLKEARENLADAVRMIREPVDLSKLLPLFPFGLLSLLLPNACCLIFFPFNAPIFASRIIG
jgi:predicted RNase H-like HicB family nuclease